MNRTFITGDTHGTIDLAKIVKFAQKYPDLDKTDILIITGDFGGVWYGTDKDDEVLNWWAQQPWTTVFVDGNHENFNALNALPVKTWCEGQVHEVAEGVYHLIRGEVFYINSYRFFAFGGAISTDRGYRKEGVSWWKGELPTHDEVQAGFRNCGRVYNEVDFIISHSCPENLKNYLWRYESEKTNIEFVYGPEYENIHYVLQDFCNALEYRKLFFGHYHIDREIKGAQCCYDEIYEITDSGIIIR